MILSIVEKNADLVCCYGFHDEPVHFSLAAEKLAAQQWMCLLNGSTDIVQNGSVIGTFTPDAPNRARELCSGIDFSIVPKEKYSAWFAVSSTKGETTVELHKDLQQFDVPLADVERRMIILSGTVLANGVLLTERSWVNIRAGSKVSLILKTDVQQYGDGFSVALVTNVS